MRKWLVRFCILALVILTIKNFDKTFDKEIEPYKQQFKDGPAFRFYDEKQKQTKKAFNDFLVAIGVKEPQKPESDDPVEKKDDPVEKKDDPVEKKDDPVEKKDDPVEKPEETKQEKIKEYLSHLLYSLCLIRE